MQGDLNLGNGPEAGTANCLPSDFGAWVRAKVRGRWLKVGRLWVVPQGLTSGSESFNRVMALFRGRLILYREQTQWNDFYSFKDKSVGFDKAVYEVAVREGAEYVITYAQRERRMVVAHISNFKHDLDLGRGLQRRAKEAACIVLDGLDSLPVPSNPIRTIDVEGAKA